jgi:hypothetical protein
MLKYFLWMQKLPDRARWGIIVGGYFANRLAGGLARSNPNLAPWLLPFRILYVVFVIFTWLAYPLFNLMLFLHPMGRHALSDEQRTQARWVGLCLALALASLVGWLIDGRNPDYLIPALVFGLLAVPTSAIYGCQKGWPRLAMLGLTLGLAAAGFCAVALISFLHPRKDSDLGALATGSFTLFLIGTFVSQWIANWLSQQRPKR